MKHLPLFASLLACPALIFSSSADVKPIRVLLLTGGCCHDYAHQKDILKQALESRANIEVTQIHTDDGSTHPNLPIYGNAEYAKGFDVVLHDECAADVNDPKVVSAVLKPHQDGLPGVNLHCAMHCYRIGDPNQPAQSGTPHAYWFDYLGLQSSGHGAQKPISIAFTSSDSPVTRGFTNWVTVNEELYNNIQIGPRATPLARGAQDEGKRPGQNNTVVAWTNEYGPNKTRVFSTTIGHNNETVSDSRYLDLVTRGVLWATGHLGRDGKPEAGYGPVGK